jgi:hypothetical protein
MLVRIKNGFVEININDFIIDEEYYKKIMFLKQEQMKKFF